MEMNFDCSNKLKYVRINMNYTQEYLAYKLGISQKSYSDLESGKTKMKEKYLVKICELYELTPDYFCNLSCSCNANQSVPKILDILENNDVHIPDNLRNKLLNGFDFSS